MQAVASATLLFVDDEANILSSLKRLFRPQGYKILVASSGKEGLEIMENNTVDLVISDMRMPEMDGAAFLAKVAEEWPYTVRILLTGYADIESTIAAINLGKIYKYICKPWDDNDIKLSVRHALQQRFLEQERKRLLALTTRQNIELQAFNTNLEEKVQQRTKELRELMSLLEKAHKSLKSNFVSSIKIFSNIIELREGASTGHARRVADHARNLAHKLNLDTETVQQIIFAALLHDIGKVGLPDHLLNKPITELAGEERIQAEKHPAIGEGLLMGLENMRVAASLIRSQHENFNGNGYPDKLSGEEIPIGARIIAIINDYDELLHGTLSHKKYTQNEALNYLQRNKDKRYDPDLVKHFLEMVGQAKPLPVRESLCPVKSNGLKVGMVLARDLYAQEKVLLLSRGQEVNDSIIRRIHDLERVLDEDLDIYIAEQRG